MWMTLSRLLISHLPRLSKHDQRISIIGTQDVAGTTRGSQYERDISTLLRDCLPNRECFPEGTAGEHGVIVYDTALCKLHFLPYQVEVGQPICGRGSL